MVLLHFMVLLRVAQLVFLSIFFASQVSPLLPYLFFAAMDRSALLFGLSRSTVDILGCVLDLDGDSSLIHLAPRDLDFFEIFSGAGHLSSEMQEESGSHYVFFWKGKVYAVFGML